MQRTVSYSTRLAIKHEFAVVYACILLCQVLVKAAHTDRQLPF